MTTDREDEAGLTDGQQILLDRARADLERAAEAERRMLHDVQQCNQSYSELGGGRTRLSYQAYVTREKELHEACQEAERNLEKARRQRIEAHVHLREQWVNIAIQGITPGVR